MFICPDLQCECIQDDAGGACVAFKRGISTMIPNIKILQNLCDDDLDIDLNQIVFPMILELDVGVCAKYDKIITKCNLMDVLQNYSEESNGRQDDQLGLSI